jgi:hypothetical protein
VCLSLNPCGNPRGMLLLEPDSDGAIRWCKITSGATSGKTKTMNAENSR